MTLQESGFITHGAHAYDLKQSNTDLHMMYFDFGHLPLFYFWSLFYATLESDCE